MRRRLRPLLASIALVTLLLSACGGGGLPTMSDDAASRVHAQVTAVRDAVTARDADGAARALATLRSTVEHLRRSGDVSGAKAAEILAAAADEAGKGRTQGRRGQTRPGLTGQARPSTRVTRISIATRSGFGRGSW